LEGEGKMKKKILSLVIMTILIATVVSGNSINKVMDVKAEEYRNGYALIPQKYDSTGIDTKTTFLLKADENDKLTMEEVKNGFKVDGDIKFTVKKDEKGFIINLQKELEKNSIYTFHFKGITWSYQTMSEFSLLGVLPRNESVNVPTNTGIEFYFSHEGAKVEDYFSIEPKVEGSFESHGNVIAFVPKGGLKAKTVYKITLKKGVKLNKSMQTLTEDYVFSFETSPEENEEYKRPSGYFNFNNIINEFATSEKPNIPMNYNVYDEKDSIEPISVNVYAYKTIDDFASVISKYNEVPKWSHFGILKEKIQSKGLSEVMTFKQTIDINKYDQKFLQLPDKLPSGYYLVNCNWKDINFQTLIQVTDLSFYYMSSGSRGHLGIMPKGTSTSGNDKNIIWINDLKTGKPINNAVVTVYGGKEIYKSNTSGIVEVSAKKDDKNENKNNMIYKIKSGNRSALLVDYNYNNSDSISNHYWKYFQTDRGIYKPNDTVEFWGFLQNRYEDEKIDDITVEITENRWFYWDFLPFNKNTPYEQIKLKTNEGFYNGSIELPNLDEGSYEVSVKYKDKVISSSYIEVKNYIKPAYKIEVSKDKKAIFLDEKVNFDIKTLFFEGTPVSNLKVNYNINGLDYVKGTKTTDKKGNVRVTHIPKYLKGSQGISNIRLNAYAQLPESGEIFGNDSIKVFINDINVDIRCALEKDKGTISAKVNKYDLTRLNDNTAKDSNDYLGDVLENQKISGTIYKNEWKKKEVGEYYDFINKVVRKRYEYYTEKTIIKDIVLVTNKEGEAETKLNLPYLREGYYLAEFKTTDSNGRKMEFTNYFSRKWEYSPYHNENDRYMLKSDKDTFEVDEEIKVEFVNNDKLLGKGSYLYVTAQNGIKDIEVLTSPKYNRKFDANLIPNAEIRGIYFNGKTYVEAEAFRPKLDFETNRITFEAKTNKDNYKPGDLCTVTLKATVYSKEKQKNIPVKDVYVNLSLVDEALLKLKDNKIDTLQELYRWVGSGIGYTYKSHCNTNNNMIGLRFKDLEQCDTGMAESKSMNVMLTMNDKVNSEDVYVRSIFKDTALFKTMKLNENGEGTFTFKLSDNVTSWRMTFSGISKSLKAGSNKEELTVSLPFFINTSLNKTYLVGDKPYVGVSVYGKELKEGENITYEVTAEGTDYKVTAKGKAFERVNIPLWEMKEGSYKVIVKAISDSGHSDGIKQEIKVVKTYHEMQVADYYDLVKGIKINTTDKGITKLTMLDKGRGKFIPELYSLSYNNGKRIDQKYIAYMASEILNNKINIEDTLKDEVKLSDYQTQDGGFAILPYAESNVETTVKLLPLIKEEVNIEKLKKYLYNELNNKKSRNKVPAIYGLAILEEPVLLELQKVQQISNLNLKDHLYLALAYSELGDEYMAEQIYKEKISKYVDAYKTVKRIKYGKSVDDYLEYSALMMMLASNLNMDDKDLFYEYVKTTNSKEILVNSEKLFYIMNEINKLSSKEPKVVYSYQGKTYSEVIKDGWPITVKIPSTNLDQFKVKSVEGEVALIAIYDRPLINSTKQDENLKVSKTYYNFATNKKTNTFNESDIVKVVIDVDIDKKAVDNYYTVTDFAPSGLVPIASTWNYGFNDKGGRYYYKDVEGQKVTMYISKDYKYDDDLYYYARVITPGTYKADGTIVSGSKVRDSIRISDTSEITID
jgi:hypothetical protein